MTIAKREIRYGGAMLDQREIDAVVNVMKTSMVPMVNVQSFEARCAKLLGKRYGVMVNSGSAALLMAVRLLDLPPDSEIITPTLTFGTDISGIVLNGHVPVLVDVEPDTYQIDIDRIERNITPKTKAMLIPNLVGGMPDWDRLRAIADKHGLKLIEDSCDTLGGTYRGRPAGERGHGVPVRPDGRISIPLVQDVQAAGKSSKVLADDVKAALMRYVKDPVVTVIVQSTQGSGGNRVVVIGAVAQPRAIAYRAGLTLLDVMVEVGGLKEFAAGNRARLIRKTTSGVTETPLKLADLLDDGDQAANVALQPGDVIRIPERWF